jgi:hypothetical protein
MHPESCQQRLYADDVCSGDHLGIGIETALPAPRSAIQIVLLAAVAFLR